MPPLPLPAVGHAETWIMGLLRSFFGRAANPAETISRFEQEISAQRDQIFGITLFSQGIETIHSGQPEILEVNRESFRNITKRSEAAISAADGLLREAKSDPANAKRLTRFRFPPSSGHPMLDQMTRRAEILVANYERMFPSRSRAKPLSGEEIKSLMEAAADQL